MVNAKTLMYTHGTTVIEKVIASGCSKTSRCTAREILRNEVPIAIGNERKPDAYRDRWVLLKLPVCEAGLPGV
jgi:hypothetical protein